MVAILLRKGAWQRHWYTAPVQGIWQRDCYAVPTQHASVNSAVVIKGTATISLSFSGAWQRHWYTVPIQGIWQRHS